MIAVVSSLRLQEGEENLNDIRRKVRQDIRYFEGNAQEFVWYIRSCG